MHIFVALIFLCLAANQSQSYRFVLRTKGTYSAFIVSSVKAPDKQGIWIFTQLKQREYTIKLIFVCTKTQIEFVGMQCKKFQKRNICIPSVYATNCKQLSGTNFIEKIDKISC